MSLPARPALSDEGIDRLLREALQDRADDVYGRALLADAMAERVAGRSRVSQVGSARRPALAGLVLLAVLGLLVAAMAAAMIVGSRPPLATTAEVAAVERVVDAVNARDLEALMPIFSRDATVVLPHVASDGLRRYSRLTISVDTQHFPEAWMNTVAAWGMEATIRRCQGLAVAGVRCEVTTRWSTLQIELGEEWSFYFDDGLLQGLELAQVDLAPVDRTMPLAYADLTSWESWLRDAHPEQAATLLYGDHLIWNFFFRYHPGQAAEIGASISEYLQSRP